MSRKDYASLAAALRRVRPLCDAKNMTDGDWRSLTQWARDVAAVADALAADNGRFRRLWFYEACGLEDEG